MPSTNISFIAFFPFHVLISFKIAEFLKLLWAFRKQYLENKIYVYPVHPLKLKSEQNIKYYFVTFVLYVLICWLFGNEIIYTFFFVLIGIVCSSFTCFPVQSTVLESENLDIGYGAALCYYENYLKMILVNFNERIEEFKSFHNVPVEKKLFILIPQSCKVQTYLDTFKYIERCQELPKYEQTRGGIKNREYNITIYHIWNDISKGIRIGIEYASPLKGLFALKEKQLISMEKMEGHRKLFVQSLQKFLKDQNDQFCELVEYDDSKKKISDILLEKCGLSHLIYESA